MGHPPATMMDILKLVADCSSDCSGRREAEIMFLHQQPLVLKRSAPTRLKLRPADRLIFVWLYEDRPTPMPGKTYPTCTGGSGACPPEDCGGPAGSVSDHAGRVDALPGILATIHPYEGR